MIRIKKAQKKHIPLLVELKLKSLDQDNSSLLKRLNEISSINSHFKEHYLDYYLIIRGFKVVGMYTINENKISLIYLGSKKDVPKVNQLILRRVDVHENK